jgi:hypothetical protein
VKDTKNNHTNGRQHPGGGTGGVLIQSAIAVGTIVTVKDRNSVHYRKQGIIVRIDDIHNEEGPLRIWFGRDCDQRYDFRRRNLIDSDGFEPATQDSPTDARIFNYTAAGLQKDTGWTTETLIDRHWRSLHHTVSIARQSFVPGGDCQVAGCSKKCTDRILSNIWGHVVSADVCGAHKEKFHLQRIDAFPWKTPPQALQKKPLPQMATA